MFTVVVSFLFLLSGSYALEAMDAAPTANQRLITACRNGRVADVIASLAAGADSNTEDVLGVPALVIAARYPNEETSAGMVRILLNTANIDPNPIIGRDQHAHTLMFEMNQLQRNANAEAIMRVIVQTGRGWLGDRSWVGTVQVHNL